MAFIWNVCIGSDEVSLFIQKPKQCISTNMWKPNLTFSLPPVTDMDVWHGANKLPKMGKFDHWQIILSCFAYNKLHVVLTSFIYVNVNTVSFSLSYAPMVKYIRKELKNIVLSSISNVEAQKCHVPACRSVSSWLPDTQSSLEINSSLMMVAD